MSREVLEFLERAVEGLRLGVEYNEHRDSLEAEKAELESEVGILKGTQAQLMEEVKASEKEAKEILASAKVDAEASRKHADEVHDKKIADAKVEAERIVADAFARAKAAQTDEKHAQESIALLKQYTKEWQDKLETAKNAHANFLRAAGAA